MKGLVIAQEEVKFPDKQDKTKTVTMTKVSVLMESNRVKEVFLSDNKKGFNPEMVFPIFQGLEDQDYVEVELTEDYQGKSKVSKFLPYVPRAKK